jgi:hypothetical protein
MLKEYEYLNCYICQVDNEIYEIVKPFLYNGGEGKKVAISKLIRLRNKERPPDKRLLSNNKKSLDNEEVEEEEEEYKLSIRWRIANFFRRLNPNGFRRRSNHFVYPQHFIHSSNNIVRDGIFFRCVANT